MSALLSATGHDDSRFYSEAKRFYIILAAGMVLVALSIGAYYLFIATDPAVRVCPLYRIFGVPCPSCGGSRAFTALFKGDFHTSWILNPNAILTTMFACSVTVIMIHDIAFLTFRRLPKRLLGYNIGRCLFIAPPPCLLHTVCRTASTMQLRAT